MRGPFAPPEAGSPEELAIWKRQLAAAMDSDEAIRQAKEEAEEEAAFVRAEILAEGDAILASVFGKTET
jgi:hypothetical protein